MFASRRAFVCLGIVCGSIRLLAQDVVVPGFAAQVAPKARQATYFHSGLNSYLGVGVVEVTEERAKALNLKDTHGVEVKHVDESSPAGKAGLKENDVVLDYNGQRVEGVEQFIRFIGETPAGRKVNITVWRNGSSQTLAATLEARSRAMIVAPVMPNLPMVPTPPMPPEFAELEKRLGDLDSRFSIMTINSSGVGIECESLTAQLADYFGVKQGVLVRSVASKTPAEKAGLKAGDVVIKVAGTPVMSPREITGAVRASRGRIGFTVVRSKKEMTLEVEMPESRMPSNRN